MSDPVRIPIWNQAAMKEVRALLQKEGLGLDPHLDYTAGIYEGETYDARKEMAGWDAPGFKPDARWQPALIDRAVQAGALVWQRSEPIRVTQELKPIAVAEPTFAFQSGLTLDR